ncbi:Receptor protein kinase FERONIA [Spatholobus suberectus]|nr:Receptor protein kinase FERONIA [Spatholobus suberectus]
MSWCGLVGHTPDQIEKAKKSSLCTHFSMREIKVATNDFDEALLTGTGGFGSVYKGSFDGGATYVAIKRANPMSEQGVSEFETEILWLSQLRHNNLVSLLGYCNEDGEMILGYSDLTPGVEFSEIMMPVVVVAVSFQFLTLLEIAEKCSCNCNGYAVAVPVPYLGHQQPLFINDEYALEMLYRVSIGNENAIVENAFGTWLDDFRYISGSQSGSVLSIKPRPRSSSLIVGKGKVKTEMISTALESSLESPLREQSGKKRRCERRHNK